MVWTAEEVEALQAVAALAAHNRRHGTTHELVRRFPQGSHGAWEARAAGGATGGAPSRVVLKVPARFSFARHGRRRLPVSEVARAAGYPTPAILGWGTAPPTDGAAAGVPYYLQALVPGEPLPRLTAGWLEQMLAIVDLQANVQPDTSQDWSGYVQRVVFEGESGWTARLGTHSAQTAALLDRLQAVAAPCRGVDLGHADLVHGDFASWNLLAAGGRVTAVIDAQAAGKGNRAVDLARVYGWEYADTDAAMRRRLRRAIVAAAGAPGARLCLVYTAIDLVANTIRADTPDALGAAGAVARALIAECRRLT